MPGRLQKLVHVLALARLELAFPAIANNWLVIFLAGQVETGAGANPALARLGLGLSLVLGAVVAVGLSIYALALNDVLDARHDRAFSPQRPIAAGRVGLRTAVALAFLCLMAALGASVFFGAEAVLLCIAAAAMALFYDLAGKFLPAAGITALALTWAAGMIVPNPHLSFGWPAWLTMTHVMGCTLAVHVIEGKRPRLRTQDWLVAAGAWTFWTMVMQAWMSTRAGALSELVPVQPGMWVGPLVAIAAFLVAATWSLHGRMRPLRSRRAAGAEFREIAMLWLIAFDAAWLLSADATWPGLLMLGIFAVALAMMRLSPLIARLTAEAPTYRVNPRANPLEQG